MKSMSTEIYLDAYIQHWLQTSTNNFIPENTFQFSLSVYELDIDYAVFSSFTAFLLEKDVEE